MNYLPYWDVFLLLDFSFSIKNIYFRKYIFEKGTPSCTKYVFLLNYFCCLSLNKFNIIRDPIVLSIVVKEVICFDTENLCCIRCFVAFILSLLVRMVSLIYDPDPWPWPPIQTRYTFFFEKLKYEKWGSDYDPLQLTHWSGSFLAINVSLKACTEIPRATLISSFPETFFVQFLLKHLEK